MKWTCPVRLTVTGHGAVNACVIDLSEGGARIQDAAAVPVGSHGTIGLDGEGAASPFAVRNTEGRVLDVAFELDQMATAALRSTLERLASRIAA